MFMRKTILDNLLKIPFDANNNYEHLSIDKVHMFINPSYQFNPLTRTDAKLHPPR